MPIFGLVWVASWVGCFFSSAHDLLKLPTYLPNLSRSQSSSSENSSLGRHYFSSTQARGISTLQKLPQLATATVFPEPASGVLQTQSPLKNRPALNQTLGWLGAVENLLTLPSFESSSGNKPFSQKSYSTLDVGFVEPALDSQDNGSLPLQSFLFKSWQRVLTYTNPAMSQVVVVKPKHSPAPSDNSIPVSKRRGFWQCTPKQRADLKTSPEPEGFQIWVRGCFVATVPTEAKAKAIARTWQQVLQTPDFKPSRLQPAMVDGLPAGKFGKRTLFKIDPALAADLNRDSEKLAIEWVNNLRVALKQSPLSLSQAQARLHGLVETDEIISGWASWYGPYFQGNLTANGETFNQEDLTAAHPSLPFNTYLRVTNLNNGRSVIVRINDRGPYFEDRTLDLSHEAARRLNGEETGVFPVEAVVLVSAPVQTDDSTQKLARL